MRGRLVRKLIGSTMTGVTYGAAALAILLLAGRRHGVSWAKARPQEAAPLARAPSSR